MEQTMINEDKDIILLTKLKEKNPAYCLSSAQTRILQKQLENALKEEEVIIIFSEKNKIKQNK